STVEPWDEKNRREHDYVTHYIVEILQRMGLQVDVAPEENLQFGSIEHLCERITARGNVDFFTLLEKLTPTPAICGYPKEEAMREIEHLERHSRYCYGGYIAVKQGGRRKAYLILRCALVTPGKDHKFCYTVYSGGGITGDSVAAREWDEASDKAELLIDCIKK
ncbi:MAG: chorismate-binding protein, partial [Roseburia sp.]|nr:chorismate-binding protein [Roseburia sp.]